MSINLSPSEELVYALALIMGDGFVRRKSEIAYASKDKILVDNCQKSLHKIGLNSTVSRRVDGIWVLYAGSKEFVNWFRNLGPENLKKFITGYEKSFVKGFYEAEGTLIRYRCGREVRASMSNTNYNLLLLVSEAVRKLGFDYSLFCQKRDKGRNLYCLNLKGGGKTIAEFIETIKPDVKNNYPKEAVDGSYKRGYWTHSEVQFLRESYQRLKSAEIGEILNRTRDAVKRKASYLGLRKSSRPTESGQCVNGIGGG